MAVDQRILDAEAALDGKVTALDQKVDAFIASHQTNNEADVAAIVAKTAAQGDAVDAVAAKLA